MFFLANRANLDKRTVLNRIHNYLHTQLNKENFPIEQVWYHTSLGNKKAVRAAVDCTMFLQTQYPTDRAELHVSFDFPSDQKYDFYKIRWLEHKRSLMLGWHQDETQMDLGKCHFQLDYQEETIQREPAEFLDKHPLNVFEQRTTQLVEVIDSLTYEEGLPTVAEEEIYR